MTQVWVVDDNDDGRRGRALNAGLGGRLRVTETIRAFLMERGLDQSECVVLVHASNSDLSHATPGRWIGAGARTVARLGPYMVTRILEEGGWILLFSGGTPAMEPVESIRRVVSGLPDVARGRYAELFHAEDLAKEIDWTSLLGDVLNEGGWEAVFGRGSEDLFRALAILCQGYLVAMLSRRSSSSAGQGVSTPVAEGDKVRRAIKDMGWRDELRGVLGGGAQAAHAELSDPSKWRDCLQLKPDHSVRGCLEFELAKDERQGSNHDGVHRLFDWIFDDAAVVDPERLPELVAETYLWVALRLNRGQRRGDADHAA